MKVDFIVCGVQKGGTSALDTYLRRHPGICMARRKEIHFFDNEEAFRNGAPGYSSYHAFFQPQSSHQLLGESTPVYMYWRESPKRIWQYNPNMKLIAVLRNPVERAYSHWNMGRLRKTETASFWDAIQEENTRCREALPLQHRKYSYIDRGFYLEQLRRLWSYFPKNQVLILRHEELKQFPNETMQKVFAFLGVEMCGDIEPVEVLALPYAASIGLEEREYLISIFEFEIKGLERVLGWDCSNWLSA